MNICGIIMAAGEGRRAGGAKLSRIINNKPMLEWVVETAISSKLTDIILVTGHERDFAERLAKKYNVRAFYNKDYASGMSSSLRCGINNLPKSAQGVAIILGDMPFLSHHTVDLLIDCFCELKKGIIIPVYYGKKGHPPIMSTKYVAEVLEVSGDKGAREVIGRHQDDIAYIEVNDSGTIKDIDFF
ncbi:MAG: nucleotidyltransferase family protein [Thermoanaerobacterales bacterium]|jgi:molybdenum cofactor cytidylyltransferase|nr:nucleotidyltransferase family protein [Thermoanaerobacterales bacterium]